jgi:hypothetical protein
MASYIYAEVVPSERDLDGMPCKCCRLCNGWDLPSPKPLELPQIRSLANTFAHEIFADWTNLNAILKRFEAVAQEIRKAAPRDFDWRVSQHSSGPPTGLRELQKLQQSSYFAESHV